MNIEQTILVVAAHPDDEALGCGATISKYVNKGFRVRVIFMTNGVSSRRNTNKNKIKKRKLSAIKSCKILGASKPIFLNFPDNSMDKVSLLKIIKKIEVYISKIKPNIIFTHHYGDLNVDHQITSRAVITACRPINKKFLKKIFFFYIPSSTEWSYDKENKFKPNWFEDVEKTYSKKIKSLNCYKMEIRNWPHPRSIKNINQLANVNASMSGLKKVEVFELFRAIN